MSGILRLRGEGGVDEMLALVEKDDGRGKGT